MANNIDVKTIEDKTILDAAATLLTADVTTAGTVAGTGAVTVVKHNGALNLITLRYRLKDVADQGREGGVQGRRRRVPGGLAHHRIRHADRARQGDRVARPGRRRRSPSAPTVETVNVDLPRIAMYTTWANTEKVGWVRLAFDRWEIPFDLIHKDHVQAGANLRVEVRRDRDAAPDAKRQVDRLRAAEAVEAAALQEERQVQVAGHLRGNRRCARRHGAGGRGGVPEVRGGGRRAGDVRRGELLPRRVRHREGRRRADSGDRASTRRGRT